MAQSYRDRQRAGIALFPPDAKQAVIGGYVNFTTLSRDYQVALVNVRQTELLQDVQAREGGTISDVGGRFALLSPRDAYITPLSNETLATVYPANRQALARWVRQVTATGGTPGGLSPFLADSADAWAERAEVVVAVDLADAFDPGLVRAGLDGSLALSGKSVNRDFLAKLIASAKGLVFAAEAGEGVAGTLRVEFGADPQPFRDVLPGLFFEMLDTQGMALAGVSSWPVVFTESSMTLAGPLATPDLRRVLSLFQFPGHHEAEPAAGRPPAAGVAATPDQTKRYLAAVDNVLAGVKPPKDQKDYVKTARWTEKAAEQIEHLSGVGVDPLAVDAGLDAARKLRAIAGSLRGVPADIHVAESGSYYYVSGGYPGWAGWGRARVPFVGGRSVSTNYPQVQQQIAQTVANDDKRRQDLWSQLTSAMIDARRKLGEKYGAGF